MSKDIASEILDNDAGFDDELTLSQAELIERISWIIKIRWLAFVGVLFTILFAHVAFSASLPWGPLCATTFSIPAYNLICYIAWRRMRAARRERLELASAALANVQISLDLVALGALIHFSGGVENPFAYYFVFHMVIASILLSSRAVIAQMTLAIAIFSTVALGEYSGFLPHHHSPVGIMIPTLHSNGLFVFASIWSLATALSVTAYLTTSISAHLRMKERQIVRFSRRIERDAEALQDAYNQLAKIEAAKSAYARKAAHELRSPLAAMESLLQTVANGLQGPVSEQIAETIDLVRQRIRSLLDLVTDLLALAAAKEARDLSTRCDVDLRLVMECVEHLLSPHAEARGIRLDVHMDEDLPQVYGDREAMEGLLTNLVSNAVKYSRDGGVVSVRLMTAGSCVKMEVADSGIGIEASDMERIFEEFFRAKNARALATPGTGLGLSIVKGIVDSHGGTICVESEVGKGTTFGVILPVRASVDGKP